ncbi:hypothetical protein FHX08_005785 [Rhizobium sp. BK529]|uniref:hypothetical protein n=1 Tax=unclassified Rhizobium TaxID=2613769 RepID=UPI001049CF80|nr:MULTISPECIES: hypothetical protein [unclassified Rhizobium]MBB3595373.1 hypothetical protein [Rhizobium sp. BK529]
MTAAGKRKAAAAGDCDCWNQKTEADQDRLLDCKDGGLIQKKFRNQRCAQETRDAAAFDTDVNGEPDS